MRSFCFVLIILATISCNREESFPSDILKPDKMKLVMWDFVKADVYSEEFVKRDHPGTDTAENMQLQLMIFNKHHITRKEFYKSYQYYFAHTELMNALLDSITASQNKPKIFEKD